MSKTTIIGPKPRKIHRFRCLKCGRVFDTYKKTPSCCGNLKKLVIPPPIKIAKRTKKVPKEKKKAPKEKIPIYRPKPGTTSRPLKDDPIERLKKRQAKPKKYVDWSTNTMKKHWEARTPKKSETEPGTYSLNYK